MSDPSRAPVRVVCIARHALLAEHVCALARGAALEPFCAVGFAAGYALTLELRPDAVLCDYDLLVSAPIAAWFGDARVAATPLIAVSLTRRPDEAVSALDSSLAAFLYLPTFTPESIGLIVRAIALGKRPDGVALPATASPLSWPSERGASRPRA
ncbi:MAG: hypothetical protein ABJD07_04475 [Gemmatimonadaceae bacterium]